MHEQPAEFKWRLITTTTLVAICFAAVLSYMTAKNVVLSSSALEQTKLLQEENDRLGTIIDTIPGGVAFIDVETLTFIRANEGFKQLVGRRSSELIGHRMLVIVPDVDHPDMLKRALEDPTGMWGKMTSEPFINPDAQILHKDGGLFKAKVIFRGVKIAGKRRYLMFIDPRITEIRGPDNGGD